MNHQTGCNMRARTMRKARQRLTERNQPAHEVVQEFVLGLEGGAACVHRLNSLLQSEYVPPHLHHPRCCHIRTVINSAFVLQNGRHRACARCTNPAGQCDSSCVYLHCTCAKKQPIVEANALSAAHMVIRSSQKCASLARGSTSRVRSTWGAAAVRSTLGSPLGAALCTLHVG